MQGAVDKRKATLAKKKAAKAAVPATPTEGKPDALPEMTAESPVA
jgi:hypothetical protein